ncbi:MAG TPA: DUF202 domain-containing protein [Micromonosporaceae bacterium]|nr:DUF202 domain-containing protein [Micromonosporaceae bacterium]
MDAERQRPEHRELERDLQGNERTYLAWLRTALAVMTLGVAIPEFRPPSGFTYAAGGVLIAAGITGLLYGTVRYRRVARGLRLGRLPVDPTARGPEAAAAVLTVAIIIALALIVAATF